MYFKYLLSPTQPQPYKFDKSYIHFRRNLFEYTKVEHKSIGYICNVIHVFKHNVLHIAWKHILFITNFPPSAET